MKFNQNSLGFRVILKPFIEKVSKGGIALVRDERTQAINTDKGEVYMIGPEAFKALGYNAPITVGNKVYYSKYGAKVIKDEVTEELYILINDEDILVEYTDNE